MYKANFCLFVYLFVCLFVCLFVFVCMKHIQIHISEPIWTKLCTHLPLGLEEVVGYVWTHNISNFPNFSAYFVGSECRFVRTIWLPARETRATELCPWCGASWCDIMDVTCTVGNTQKTRRSERNACVWKWDRDETGRKWIMNCTCNYIAFIQIIT